MVTANLFRDRVWHDNWWNELFMLRVAGSDIHVLTTSYILQRFV